MNNLLTRTLSGIVLILLVGASILLSEYSMLALLLLIYSLAIYEFRNMFSIKGNVLFLIVLVIGLIFMVSNYLLLKDIIPQGISAAVLILIFTVIFLYYLLFKESSVGEIGKMLFAGIWISSALTFYMNLGWSGTAPLYNPQLLILLMIVIWVNDVGAYFFGSIFGKTPLAPNISPGKTLEGFISGLILSGVAGFVIYLIIREHSIFFWVLLSLVVSLGATAGDLFESKLKREAGTKDSGNLIPGHGGILDRFDSLFLSAPVLYLFLIIWDKL